MPSMLLPANISGGLNIFSGQAFALSGGLLGSGYPWVGGVQLRADRNNSGNVYVALSGGVTITSGRGDWSGAMDGMQMGPGDFYFVPRLGLGNAGASSGQPQLFVQTDTTSGWARVYHERF